MMTVVPVGIRHAGVVGVVLHHLLFREAEPVGVGVLALRQVDQLVHMLAAERGFAEMRCNRWSHLREHHDVVFGHSLCLPRMESNYKPQGAQTYSFSNILISVDN